MTEFVRHLITYFTIVLWNRMADDFSSRKLDMMTDTHEHGIDSSRNPEIYI